MKERALPPKTYHHGNLASELLKAAEQELALNGIEAFSLRAVAKRAGVSHGAPAHHFGNATGLLTALAANGYERLVEAQEKRQLAATPDKTAQFVALGLGYLDFAEANPELFRLMFSSEKPERTNEAFNAAAQAAFGKLVDGVSEMLGADPYGDPVAMKQVVASWAIVHGLADLLISGRLDAPMASADISKTLRDAVLSEIMLRVLNQSRTS
jgi:AcrR family transcriptional regulator